MLGEWEEWKKRMVDDAKSLPQIEMVSQEITVLAYYLGLWTQGSEE